MAATKSSARKSTSKKTAMSVEEKKIAAEKQTVKEEIIAAPVEVVETPVEKNPAPAPQPEVQVVPKKKIMFVASEAAPFIATGGLAEVIGSLSKAIAKDENFDVRVIIPLYQDTKRNTARISSSSETFLFRCPGAISIAVSLSMRRTT